MWEDLNNENKEAIINYGISKGYGSLDAIKNHYQKLLELMYSVEADDMYNDSVNQFKNGSKLNRSRKSKEYYDEGIRKLKEGIDKVLQNPKYKRFNTPDWKEWLTKLAIRESAGDPTITNLIGAYGYWQLMPSNRNKSKTDPNGQFEDMLDLMSNNYDYLVKNMSEDDWKKAYSKGYDMHNLLGGAHLGGVKNTLAALRSGKNAKDANGTGVLDYMNKFGDPTKPQSVVPLYNMFTPITVPKFDFKKQFSTPSVFNSATQQFTDWNNNMTSLYANFNNLLNTMLAVNNAILNQTPLVDWQKEADIEKMKLQQLVKDVKENNVSSPLQFFTTYDDDYYSHKADENYAQQLQMLRMIHNHKQQSDWTKSPFIDYTKPITAAYGGNLNTLPSFKGGKPLEPVLYGNGGEKEVKDYINKQFPSAKAFGDFLPDYRVYADPSFTRDNTGAGSIEYMNENSVTYPNGFTYNNPYPDTATLIYDPKSNSKDDIKLDLLHHYRFNDPVYKDLVNAYADTLNPGNILFNSQLGEKFRQLPKKLQTPEIWNAMVKELITKGNDTEYMVQGIDGSLRGIMATPEQRQKNHYAPLEVYLEENLNTPLAVEAYLNIKNYLESERLPNVDIYPNKHSDGGNLYANGGDDVRKFSYDNSVVYDNTLYPTAVMPLLDFNGNTKDRTVFPMNGEYYAVGDDGKAHNIMLDHTVPEVTVTAPMETFVNNRNSDYLTLSNDNTEVAEIPYSPYQDSQFPKYQALTLPQGVRDNLFTRLLFAIKPEKKSFNRYENSTSRYSLKDDLNDDAPNEWERSSKLGNLGLVKVGENKYKLYDENGNIIKQCAKTRNELEKMLGHPTTNNAWDSFGMYGDSTLFNGYPPKVGPYTWPSYVVQNQIAADRTQKALENIDLQTGDVVDLYSPFSHYAKRAYNEGTLNRSNSHTGVIFQPYPGLKSKTYIIHNVSGNISVDPINKFLVDGENMFPKWRMTGFHRPGTKEHPYFLNGKPVHK